MLETLFLYLRLQSGMVAPGNIDLVHRHAHHNANGTISTVRSISVRFDDGPETLIPTIGPSGEDLSEDNAIARFMITGQHLGMFIDAQSANAYAKRLHKSQARLYKN